MTPTAPAGSPPFAVAIVRDLVVWVQKQLKLAPQLPAYAKAVLPSAADAYSSVTTNAYSTLIYVTDDAGGAVPAFTDGTNWRRVTDRNVIS